MKKLVLAFSLAAIAASAYAMPEVYNIDPNHSAPRFEYNHFGYSTQVHRFDKTRGKIVFDREAKTGSVDVAIDAKSVNTGYPLFNERIQEADFFDTAHYPTITFKSTAVRFDGDKPVAVDGELTVKGVTKPVTLTLTSFEAKLHPMLGKDALGANAVTKVLRSDFGMGKFAPFVSDEVTLSIAVEAVEE